MKSIAAVVIGLAVSLSSAATSADQGRFTGDTTAGATLIGDALRNVMLVTSAKWGCSTLDLVKSEVLPPSYVPVDAAQVSGSATVKYERWAVTACSRTEPFLFGWWADRENGGSLFRVSYPFPPAPGVSTLPPSPN